MPPNAPPLKKGVIPFKYTSAIAQDNLHTAARRGALDSLASLLDNDVARTHTFKCFHALPTSEAIEATRNESAKFAVAAPNSSSLALAASSNGSCSSSSDNRSASVSNNINSNNTADISMAPYSMQENIGLNDASLSSSNASQMSSSTSSSSTSSHAHSGGKDDCCPPKFSPMQMTPQWDESGMTPLQLACIGGHEAAVLMLINNAKAEIDARASKTNKFCTALHIAISHGHLNIVKILLDAGADPFLVNSDGLNAAFLAIKKDEVTMTEYLLCRYGNTTDMEIGDKGSVKHPLGATCDLERNSLLHAAVRYSNVYMVRWLMHRTRIPLNAINFAGETPLHIAAALTKLDIVQFFIRENHNIVAYRDHQQKKPVDHVPNNNIVNTKAVRNLLNGVESGLPPDHIETPFYVSNAVKYQMFLLPFAQVIAIVGSLVWFEGVLAIIAAWLMFGTSAAFVFFLFPKVNVRQPYYVGLAIALVMCCVVAFYIKMGWVLLAKGGVFEFILFFVAFFLTARNYYISLITDPGYVTKSGPETLDDDVFLVNTVNYLITEKKSTKSFCTTCEVVRPDRAKHCKTCDRCVKVMDHHCLYINNCVGENNHIPFFMFLVHICWGILFYIYLQLRYLIDVANESDAVDFVDRVTYVYTTDTFQAICIVLAVFNIIWIFVILVSQLTYLSQGQTTNEVLNAMRYEQEGRTNTSAAAMRQRPITDQLAWRMSNLQRFFESRTADNRKKNGYLPVSV